MDTQNPEELSAEAKAAYQKGDYAKAAGGFEAALNGYRTQNDHLMAAETANNLSVTLLLAGEAKEALDAALGTDAIFEEAGDKTKQAMAMGNQAAALDELGRLDEAEKAYQSAVDLLKETGQKELLAQTARSLANVQLRTGKQLEAATNMQIGLEGLEKPSIKERFLRWILKITKKISRL
jgi:tetratricopeptide (TPR) repeat protein